MLDFLPSRAVNPFKSIFSALTSSRVGPGQKKGEVSWHSIYRFFEESFCSFDLHGFAVDCRSGCNLRKKAGQAVELLMSTTAKDRVTIPRPSSRGAPELEEDFLLLRQGTPFLTFLFHHDVTQSFINWIRAVGIGPTGFRLAGQLRYEWA